MSKKTFLLFFATLGIASASNYFQQHVNYTVQAELNHLSHRLSVKEKLVYTNHSSDSLATLYFHLYFNKFNKGAYSEDGALREEADGYIQIDSLWQNGNLSHDYEIDHTLMSLSLKHELAPGDSVELNFTYRSQLPHAEGRYGFLGDHNDVGNWLIVPVVYDCDGWHLHQHLDSEFYQEWGDFDVELTVPRGFVVGATGNLLNPDSALLDTSNDVYQWRAENPHDTTHATLWHFSAKNVTDFAWTADPEYRYFTKSWRGIAVNYLVMRPNYDAWKKEIDAGLGAIRLLSQMVGPYPYKQITVADTYIQAGGMEYPNIVFINTSSTPREDAAYFRAVVIHEIAHNWFFGLLASNQTEFEWQDEGFTQFAEIVIMEKLYGRSANTGRQKGGLDGLFFGLDRNDRDDTMYHYLRFARSGREIDPINTMPDRFRSGHGIASYDKMAVVLGMLEDVLGDDLFWRGMRNYYDAWNHKHPQPTDFIRVMEETAQRPLKWFFDEWVYEVRTLDLALDDVRQTKINEGYLLQIDLENKGDISMPFDLLSILDNGDSLRFRVPVQPYGLHVPGHSYLAYWHFSNKKYTAHFVAPRRVVRTVIDPDGRLADVDRRNNSSDWFSGVRLAFMRPQLHVPYFDFYTAELWPSFLYNDADGPMPGLLFESSYLNSTDIFKGHVYYGTRNQRLNLNLQYKTPLSFISHQLWQRIKIFSESGVRGTSYSWDIPTNRDGVLQLGLNFYDAYAITALAAPWQKGQNTLIDAAYTTMLSDATIRLHARSSLHGSDFNFSRIDASLTRSISADDSDLLLKVGLRLGAGRGNLPLQEMYNLTGASALRQYENPYYRARGALPIGLQRDGHVVEDETARVRGAGLTSSGSYITASNIAALSLDLEIPSFFETLAIPYIERLGNNLFGDIGSVWNGSVPEISDFYKSFGVSITLDVPYRLTQFSGLQDIRLDLPLWLDYPGRAEKSLAFRWQLSISFAFERTPFFNG